jgi:hypothetical protein
MELSTWLRNLNTNSWLDRVDAMTSITDAMLTHTTLLSDAEKLTSCADALLERLEDGSVKCVLHALQCLKRVMQENPQILVVNKIALASLMATSSSSNRQVARDATDIAEQLLSATSPGASLAQLCNMVLHEKDRLRVVALRLMCDRMDDYHAISDTTVRRTLFPVVSKMLLASTTKTDVRIAAANSLEAIQKAIGPSEKVHMWISDYTEREEIRRIATSAI